MDRSGRQLVTFLAGAAAAFLAVQPAGAIQALATVSASDQALLDRAVARGRLFRVDGASPIQIVERPAPKS